MGRLSELQVSSELLDQPVFEGQPRKIFICCTPRSGSYLLCRTMIAAGVGVPHEYFNPIVIRQMAPRLGLGDKFAQLQWLPVGRLDRLGFRRTARAAEAAFLPAYIQILLERRCLAGVFAAKIHFRDFTRVLDNAVGHELLRDATFIFLYRENMLAQAISEHFSQLTGRWGVDDTVSTPPVAKPDFFDTAAIDRALNDLSEQERGWRVFMARHGVSPLSISYEKLCEDPFAFVVAVARRVGLDPAALKQGYSETAPSPEADSALPRKADVQRHFLAHVNL